MCYDVQSARGPSHRPSGGPEPSARLFARIAFKRWTWNLFGFQTKGICHDPSFSSGAGEIINMSALKYIYSWKTYRVQDCDGGPQGLEVRLLKEEQEKQQNGAYRERDF